MADDQRPPTHLQIEMLRLVARCCRGQGYALPEVVASRWDLSSDPWRVMRAIIAKGLVDVMGSHDWWELSMNERCRKILREWK